MTLNAHEMHRTGQELRANLALTGLTREQVAADLGFTSARLDATLTMSGADPVDAWLLRDYLVQVVRDAGGEPAPFTILTTANKLRARMWFRLAKAPRHDFAAA